MTVRTYKPRRGRLTGTQADALTRLWPAYGLDVDGRPIDPVAVWGRVAPLVLEIGSGMGETTARMAAADPGRDVLAVEVHTPGLGNLLKLVEAGGLSHVRVAEGDALVVLEDMLGPGGLDEVRAYFPDPWPKAKHHKRRLVTPAFAALVHDRLAPGGRLHVATDWEPYAAVVRDVLERSPLRVVSTERPAHRPTTRFEQQGLDAGRRSYDVVAVRD